VDSYIQYQESSIEAKFRVIIPQSNRQYISTTFSKEEEDGGYEGFSEEKPSYPGLPRDQLQAGNIETFTDAIPALWDKLTSQLWSFLWK
jgi:hypothetical protein